MMESILRKNCTVLGGDHLYLPVLGGAWKASETVCISGIIIIFRAVSFHCRNREKDERKICF